VVVVALLYVASPALVAEIEQVPLALTIGRERAVSRPASPRGTPRGLIAERTAAAAALHRERV
jgi:hypothetical protein